MNEEINSCLTKINYFLSLSINEMNSQLDPRIHLRLLQGEVLKLHNLFNHLDSVENLERKEILETLEI